MQLYTAEDSRQCDAAIIGGGISGFALMQRAADRIFDLVTDLQDEFQKPVVVIVGSGNNGGDGLLVAALAKAAGFDVQVVSLKPLEMRTPEGTQALELAQEKGVAFSVFSGNESFENTLVIDALLGTGFNRPLSNEATLLIKAVNRADNTVLAADVPSGLCADTGVVHDTAIIASKTISFIVRKRGLYTADGPDHAGVRYFYDLQSRDDEEKKRYQLAVHALKQPVEVMALEQLKWHLPMRKRNSHKGTYGHCVLIGGNHTMAGAVLLAAEAALNAGCGLVTVVTKASHQQALNARLPEVLTAVTDDEISQALAKASVIGIGPGLGEDEWASSLLYKVYESDVPAVVDASALNLMAGIETPFVRDNWVLTPHPKEAARLLHQDSAKDVQRNRFDAANALTDKYKAAVVLKGCGTLVGSHHQTYLCDAGNPGMAVAGMGDVLTGVIAGLIASGVSVLQAAQLGTQLHAVAGDKLVERQGAIGLRPSQMPTMIRELMNT